ncbi:MAG: succinate dehydrogenase, hydrophobic membrane anchor protein [Methylophilus sp.]|nr:succinate dehydrogenase, hydrophobic membrane anchor protein [Methylophilus sp.]
MLIDLLTKKYPGMRQWLSQRISAIFLAGYSVLLVVLMLVQKPTNYAAWHAFFAPCWWRWLTLLFFASLIMHAWLGVSNVLKDYIFNVTLRAYLQILVELMLIVDLIWAALILWNI